MSKTDKIITWSGVSVILISWMIGIWVIFASYGCVGVGDGFDDCSEAKLDTLKLLAKAPYAGMVVGATLIIYAFVSNKRHHKE